MKTFYPIQGRCLLMAVLLATTLTGCRKDLCYNHEEHGYAVRVQVEASWEQVWQRDINGNDWQNHWPANCGYTFESLMPDIPSGIRAVVYNDEGDTYNEQNLSALGGALGMDEGLHPLLFYNNDTEYIVFENLPSSATASATTRTRTRAGFEELHANERTINAPDMLYGAYIPDYEAQRTVETVTLPVTLHPLTYTYVVRYEFSHGLKYVALARGALAGMAESVYLNDGHTDTKAATILYDCQLTDYGAEAAVKTFGVPDYPGTGYTRAPRTYSLNLEVRLNNGKILTYPFDVTDQLEAQPRGGVITVTGIEVSDEDGMEGGSGFDVNVDGWGEYQDIEMPLS